MISTITREQLIEVAERSLELAKIENEEVRRHILRAAQMAPRVAGSAQWWSERDQCGCLAGWVLRRSPRVNSANPDTEAEAYLEVGMDYLSALSEIVGANNVANVITVV